MITFLRNIKEQAQKAYNAYIRFLCTYFFHGPVILFYIIGVYYVFRIFANLDKDTTTITNVAFGITAIFSGLCFAWSPILENSVEDKKRIAYSGERFLHAALLLILASVINYAAITIGQANFTGIIKFSQLSWRHFITIILGSLVGLLFFWALTFVHSGIIFINRILWRRVNNFQDWDSWT